MDRSKNFADPDTGVHAQDIDKLPLFGRIYIEKDIWSR